MSFEQNTGTRAQVWHGTAKKTSGGLTKSNLMKNKHGRIVSRKKHSTAKRENRLVKAGFVTKKGHFGFMKKGSRKMRGGDGFPVGPGNPQNPQVAAMNGPNSSNFAAPANVITKGLQSGGRRHRTGKMRGGSVSTFGGVITPAKYNGGRRRKMRGGSNGLNYPLDPASTYMRGAGNGMNLPLDPATTMRGGGNGLSYGLNPAPFDGKGVGTSGIDVQIAAGMGN